jgi:tetratricopeptide (TPR) repeat protein
VIARLAHAAPLVVALALAPGAPAQTPAAEAGRLIASYHEDPARIDRARDLLEQALTTDRRVETMIALSRVYLLVGLLRAKTSEEKLAAFARGRELGDRAIELAPKSEDAHFWYTANTGLYGQTRGVLRSLALLPTMRQEIEILLSLNPGAARTHNVAANVFFEVPGLLGGDRKKAEEHWRKGIELDPRYTVQRVDYAKFLIAAGREDEARRQLQRVLDEPNPTNRADWIMRDVPRARAMLESIRAGR